MLASASSYGNYEIDISHSSCYTIDVCSDLLLGAIAAASAVGLVVLYQAITTKGSARKKRSKQEVPARSSFWTFWGM